jgi:hypothetical protein
MTRTDSTRTTSSEGAPGLPMLVFVGALFVAAAVSTWVVYEKAPTTSFFGGTGVAVARTPMPPAPLGYAVASPGASIADVELGIEWNTWDWNTGQLVGTTVFATLQRAAPGAVVSDSDTTTLATTYGAIDESLRFRWFEGPFEALTSEQRTAIAEDLATALEIFLGTPGFDGIVRIELAFVLPGGVFERFELVRDPADPTVLIARPRTP